MRKSLRLFVDIAMTPMLYSEQLVDFAFSTAGKPIDCSSISEVCWCLQTVKNQREHRTNRKRYLV